MKLKQPVKIIQFKGIIFIDDKQRHPGNIVQNDRHIGTEFFGGVTGMQRHMPDGESGFRDGGQNLTESPDVGRGKRSAQSKYQKARKL
jgi:hypothetical protein